MAMTSAIHARSGCACSTSARQPGAMSTLSFKARFIARCWSDSELCSVGAAGLVHSACHPCRAANLRPLSRLGRRLALRSGDQLWLRRAVSFSACWLVSADIALGGGTSVRGPELALMPTRSRDGQWGIH